MNICDTGLDLEHCLQLCRQVRRLQVGGSVRERWPYRLPLGNPSEGLQNPEKGQAQPCTTWLNLGERAHLARSSFLHL